MTDTQPQPKKMPTVVIDNPPKGHCPDGEWAGGRFVPTEAQPSPDLEPVRRLIGAATVSDVMEIPKQQMDKLSFGKGTLVKLVDCTLLAYDALPALRSLLAEVEKLLKENAQMKAAITKAACEGLSHE